VVNKIASLYSKSDQYGNNHIIDYVNWQIASGNLLDVSAKKAGMSSPSSFTKVKQNSSNTPASNTKIPQNSFGVNSYSMQDSGKNSQFDWSEVGEIYEDIYYPKTRWEAEGFNRYFANATKTLQKGDKKNIILSVGNAVYFIEADGYMSGDIISTMPILGNEEAVRAKREEFENATRVRNDRSGEIFDSWAGDISIRFSGSVSDNDGAANGSGANRIDALYGSSQESDQIGYYRRSDTDNEGEWESACQTENPVTLPGGAITNDPEVIEEYFRNIYEADSNESAFSMPKNGEESNVSRA
jgi:hypothetical protein